MKAEEQAEKQTEKVGPRRGEIRVVDLSQRVPRLERLAPIHAAILESLREATIGLMDGDELLERVADYSFSDVGRALRDLTLEGLVRVLWRTPFRFVAYLTDRGRQAPPRSPYGSKAVVA
jgi:hypothetical protein